MGFSEKISGDILNASDLQVVWELVEERVISTASTTEDFTGLDGDTEGAYKLQYTIINDQGTGSAINLRLNSANAVGNRQFISGSSTTITGARDSAMDIGNAPATSSSAGEIVFPATRTGDARYCLFTRTSAQASIVLVLGAIYITTPAAGTNITAIGLVAATANAIGIGSVLRLYKRLKA